MVNSSSPDTWRRDIIVQKANTQSHNIVNSDEKSPLLDQVYPTWGHLVLNIEVLC